MAIIRTPKVPCEPRVDSLRAETTSIRLDRRLRYIAELAARKQRRSLNSFIEFAIETTLNVVNIDEGGFNEAAATFASASEWLWDVDEPDRFAKLGFRYPALFSYDEQVLWKVIREMPGLWKGRYDKWNHWYWEVQESNLIFVRLREHWNLLKRIARKEAVKTELPVWIWSKEKPTTAQVDAEQPEPNPDDVPPMDDEDMPF